MSEERGKCEVVPVGPAFVPINVDAAIATWHAYQQLCQRLLDDNDYATIKGKKARKRSGWAKLRRFMVVSAPVFKEERFATEDDWGWRFIVRATEQSGRFEDGDGTCTYSELKAAYDAARKKGREGIAPTEHNVRAKALTRAKNRATSDLIGGGEVSAEELDTAEDESVPTTPTASGKHWLDDPKKRTACFVWLGKQGLDEPAVVKLLNVPTMHDYQGDTEQFKADILAAIHEATSQKPTVYHTLPEEATP